MAIPADYVTGTLSVTNGSTSFTGTGTGWVLAGFREGDTIIDITGATEYMGVIATIDENGAGTLTKAWEGPTLADVSYRMRYQPDGSRVAAQARQLIELLGNGNLQAVAGLDGSANQVPMFTGPGAMTLVPKTDLISGAAYDVQVADLAARAAYDGQDEGYAVLVADTGDGRSAIYSKVSATSGAWSVPAYVTGPVGPQPELQIGTVARGDADVEISPVEGGYQLSFTIPSQAAQGDYSGAIAYVTGDIVQDAGSSWVALQATTGNAPPTLPTTSNAYWQLLARAGNDGAGTVTSLSGGTGISIDSTDPTVPVISTTIASQAEAEAGIEADKLMTPERVAQAIAEQAAPDAYRPSNILGAVSEAEGVPTGAVIESGSNANGTYIKFADGAMWCHHRLQQSSAGNAASGSLWAAALPTWTFPAAFVDPPEITATPVLIATLGSNPVAVSRATSVDYDEVSVSGLFIWFSSSNGSVAINVSVVAIGRWF